MTEGLSHNHMQRSFKLVLTICLLNETGKMAKASRILGIFSGWERVAQGDRAQRHRTFFKGLLSRFNAILSLLHPLDSYRTPSVVGSAIGRPYLALSRIHAQAGVLNRFLLNRLGGSTAR